MKTLTPKKKKSTASRTAKAVGSGPLVRRSFETYRTVSDYTVSTLTQSEPSCFNGFVSLYRYRVTVELIEETPEVLKERLLDMWRKNDNHHNWEPMQTAARRLGFELTMDDRRPKPNIAIRHGEDVGPPSRES